jgi:mycothiol S-conjugate amidase
MIVSVGFRLMAIHAHPDDESSKGAASMAKYSAMGADVMVVTCTGGERGSVLNPKLDRPDVWLDIPRLRVLEMGRAKEILGVRHTWLGFADSGLPEGCPPPPLPAGCFARQDPHAAARRLVREIRRFKPHVVITYDEDGGYPHPDHIMTHKVSVLAFEQSGMDCCPEAGEPWQPLKLYYHIETYGQVVAHHEAMISAGLASPFEDVLTRMDARQNKDHRVTTSIRCEEYFHMRDAALRAHETQVDPDGEWFAVPLSIRQRAWPTEDYQLVRSLVDSPPREHDLFAGIREAADCEQPRTRVRA